MRRLASSSVVALGGDGCGMLSYHSFQSASSKPPPWPCCQAFQGDGGASIRRKLQSKPVVEAAHIHAGFLPKTTYWPPSGARPSVRSTGAAQSYIRCGTHKKYRVATV